MNKLKSEIKLMALSILLLLAGCNNCDNIVSRFQQTIEKDFNYCEIDQDCKVVMGICPLGCFFIVHDEKVAEVEEMVNKIKNDCSTCTFKCPVFPQKLRCIEKVCYPDVEDKYTAILFYEDCEKIAELYNNHLIGKKIEELDLHILDFEVIPSDSIGTVKKMKDDRFNNLKLFVDGEGIIESISCNEKRKIK